MKKCTWCGTEYSDDVKVCVTDQQPLTRVGGGTVTETEASEPAVAECIGPKPRSAKRDMLVGGLWCAGGLFVTILTYSEASRAGGRYLVAWGAILFGGKRFLRGAFGQQSKPQDVNINYQPVFVDRRSEARALLDVASRLEGTDRTQAIAKYREVMLLYPGTPASAEAERNIQILTSPQKV